MYKISLLFILSISLSIFCGCDRSSAPTVDNGAADAIKSHSEADKNSFPEWAKNANIYEVNIRQYSKEGTLNAFTKDLSRLKEMGVDILWLMPIHPIGVKERKGTLGSYYSVSDYRGVNPEFGTMEDFEKLVDKAHQLDMRLILDWVPNHTAWDHPWITEKPEYYTINPATGKISLPLDRGNLTDWSDVAELNYDNADLRKEQIADMHFWVEEKKIDGFRFDSPHNVPLDFWKEMAASFASNKNVFLLGENEDDDFLEAGYFNCFYAWEFVDVLKHVFQEDAPASAIDDYLKENYLKDQQLRIYYTSNHDENSWQGTVFERLGAGHKPFAILSATLNGMPLVYSGQEAPVKKRIEFFEKDPIEWNNYEYASFYKTLLNLKHKNQALWNGTYGGDINRIQTGKDEHVYAFSREKNGDKVVVICNLSNEAQDIKLNGEDCVGTYTNVFANATVSIEKDTEMTLNAWDYLVYSSK